MDDKKPDVRIINLENLEFTASVEELASVYSRLAPHLTEREFRIERLNWALRDPGFTLYLAVDQNKEFPESVVGMSTIAYRFTGLRILAEVHDAVVLGEYRGLQIGENLILALIHDAERKAESTGEQIEISLTSRPEREAANRLYRKLRFKQVARGDKRRKGTTNLYKLTVKPGPTK